MKRSGNVRGWTEMTAGKCTTKKHSGMLHGGTEMNRRVNRGVNRRNADRAISHNKGGNEMNKILERVIRTGLMTIGTAAGLGFIFGTTQLTAHAAETADNDAGSQAEPENAAPGTEADAKAVIRAYLEDKNNYDKVTVWRRARNDSNSKGIGDIRASDNWVRLDASDDMEANTAYTYVAEIYLRTTWARGITEFLTATATWAGTEQSFHLRSMFSRGCRKPGHHRFQIPSGRRQGS